MLGKLIANRNQRASVPTSSCSGACFDTQLLSQNMPWKGQGSIAVTLLPSSTLRYTLPCEQRGAATTLLCRGWNPCLRNKPCSLEVSVPSPSHNCCTDPSGPCWCKTLMQPGPAVCSQCCSNCVDLVLQLQETRWSWAGQPRDSSG